MALHSLTRRPQSLDCGCSLAAAADREAALEASAARLACDELLEHLRRRQNGAARLRSACPHGIIHWQYVLLQHHQHPEQQRQDDAVLEGAGQTRPSWPFRSVTETPVAIFCGEIILPMTPPEELVAAMSTGFRPS